MWDGIHISRLDMNITDCIDFVMSLSVSNETVFHYLIIVWTVVMLTLCFMICDFILDRSRCSQNVYLLYSNKFSIFTFSNFPWR